MSKITTHVLDTGLGKPASGIATKLDRLENKTWALIAQSRTDAEGRCRDLLDDAAPGVYRLTFDTGAYLSGIGRTSIYPEIAITFTCSGDAHYHLPVLLSDHCYTTYRGS
jgi:5-hydroxyisourate hydrolase